MSAIRPCYLVECMLKLARALLLDSEDIVFVQQIHNTRELQ